MVSIPSLALAEVSGFRIKLRERGTMLRFERALCLVKGGSALSFPTRFDTAVTKFQWIG